MHRVRQGRVRGREGESEGGRGEKEGGYEGGRREGGGGGRIAGVLTRILSYDNKMKRRELTFHFFPSSLLMRTFYPSMQLLHHVYLTCGFHSNRVIRESDTTLSTI